MGPIGWRRKRGRRSRCPPGLPQVRVSRAVARVFAFARHGAHLITIISGAMLVCVG
jgi:hypothetical protein